MTLTVRLSGHSFVSEKTKAAFERALQDGHRVATAANAPEKMAAPSMSPAPSAAGPASTAQTAQAPAPKPETQAVTLHPLNHQRVLESLEQGLAQSFDHQNLTLHVHERYLNNQAEYAEIFFQLLQQQIALSSNGHHTPHQADSAASTLESLERSMMRFHAHQSDTLSVHEQHLRNQVEFSQTSSQLLQQQYTLLTNGNTPPQHLELPPAVPAVVKDVPPAAPVVRQQASAPAPIQVAPVVNPDPSPASLPDTVSSLDVETLSNALLEVVSEKTGYPVEMLELDMDMEADLGIDSIKRVEILGTVQSLYPDLPQVNPEELAELRTLGQITDHMGASFGAGLTGAAPVVPDNGAGSLLQPSVQEVTQPVLPDIEALSGALLEVVSEKTGYPAEMLELDMDMEADLGIDSIKRVEILGTVQSLYPDLPQVNPEELAELRTLGQITDHMSQQMPATIKKKYSTDGQEPALNHGIERSLVKLKSLPAPDLLEFTLPAGHICLITDDGTPTSTKLAQALAERGWKVAFLSFPPSLLPVAAEPHPELTTESHPLANVKKPGGISHTCLQDMSEDHLKQQLATITKSHGPVGAFIHLNPTWTVRTHEGEGLPESEKAIVKHVFLMAKHLKISLTEADRSGRACFLTVARLDGEFGLGDATDFSAIGGGLFGLTKTLNLEWEGVFCRAVDLSPDLDPVQSVQYIVAELYDPNRLIVEIGYSLRGRTTLVCE